MIPYKTRKKKARNYMITKKERKKDIAMYILMHDKEDSKL